MLRKYIIFGLLSIAISEVAIAQTQTCPCGTGDRLNHTQINTLLSGNTVCAVVGNERWQEWHSGASVVELGNTPGGETVGTWTISGTGSSAAVNYNYGSGGSYNYAVCNQAPSVHFCGASFGGRDITNASVKQGKGGC